MIAVAAYTNGDDCFLAWTTPEIERCHGFAIRRELTNANGSVQTEYLENYTGFADDNAQSGEHRPSVEWPFQRYTWTDHGVEEGDSVAYRVSPVMSTADGLRLDDKNQARVGPIAVTGSAGGNIHAYFNRGVVLSQFMSRHLPANFTQADLTALKDQLATMDDGLRTFLMGQLGARLLELLAEADSQGWHIYAALYELAEQQLINGLKTLGPRAHVILSNGSSKKKGKDGNGDAASQLMEGDVDLHRRMLWSEGLGHNKFLVIARSPTDPFAVWTGSTNWAVTALCTQMNNSVYVEEKNLARVYLDQWTRLLEDRRTGRQGQELHFAAPLLAANDQPKMSAGVTPWVVWFTRTTAGQDMEAASELIKGAQQAILFLMFEPGNAGLLQHIQDRLSRLSETDDPKLYVHGVVNTLRDDAQNVEVKLVSRGITQKPFTLRVVQPEGVAGGLANWAAEVTRRDFLMPLEHPGIGHAIVHSKVIVIDPFTSPVVITGSHNFSRSASTKNDENLLILKDNRALAARYAVNIMSTYQHYRWRSYLKQCADKGVAPWHNLDHGPDWQNKAVEHDQELNFWLSGNSNA